MSLNKFMFLSVKVLCLYLSFYLEFMATLPLELQFMDIVMKIVLTQKAINNALMDLVCQIDTQGETGRILSRISIFEGRLNYMPILTTFTVDSLLS